MVKALMELLKQPLCQSAEPCRSGDHTVCSDTQDVCLDVDIKQMKEYPDEYSGLS